MKQFFEQYGGVALGILALLVLIAMITPVGNIVKTSLQGTVEKFSSGISNQTNTGLDAALQIQNKAGMEPNPYTEKVMSAQQLYDVGEANLADDDIVTVNGVDCYVLQADATKAELITKDIYDVRFDEGGHDATDAEGHVGYLDGWDTITYDYKYSNLRSWMFDFYKYQLNADPRIIASEINYYTGTSDIEISEYEKGVLKGEYVYPIDGMELYNKHDLFTWARKSIYYYGFFSTAGFLGELNGVSGYAFIWRVNHNGDLNYNGANHEPIGARPVFWITLE